MRRTRCGNQGCRERWRAQLRNDAGQSLILIVLAMSLIVALAAFAIDVAQWQVGHHKAQVAADATALAAANCLAAAKCTQTTAGGDAETKGDDIAQDNGFQKSGVTIKFTGSTVKATLKTNVASSFAGLFGLPSKSVSASATASYVAGIQEPSSVYGADCSNPTNPPTTGCSVDCSTPGVTITAAGQTNITGAIETNGSVAISLKGGAALGPVVYGSSCPNSDNNVTTKGQSSIAAGPAAATGFTSFPTTYSAVWTSATSNECTASSTYRASRYTGSGNITVSGGTSTVPSTVAISGNSTTIGSAGTPVVMCASTSISIPGNNATLNDVTLVAPVISIGGNGFSITADPSALPDGGGSPPVAIYDTSGTELSFGSNNISISGAVYAPLAEIYVGGNNGAPGLIEGNTVEVDGNNSGDGPTATLTPFAGSDALTQ